MMPKDNPLSGDLQFPDKIFTREISRVVNTPSQNSRIVPEPKEINYSYDSLAGILCLTKKPRGFSRLPDVGKISGVKSVDLIRTTEMSFFVRQEMKWNMITLILPFKHSLTSWRFGTHFYQGRPSLILFNAPGHNQNLKILYFPDFYPAGKEWSCILDQYCLKKNANKSLTSCKEKAIRAISL